MKIKAKFVSECAECVYWIEIGDTIEWDPGTQAGAHWGCFLGEGRVRRFAGRLGQVIKNIRRAF